MLARASFLQFYSRIVVIYKSFYHTHLHRIDPRQAHLSLASSQFIESERDKNGFINEIRAQSGVKITVVEFSG